MFTMNQTSHRTVIIVIVIVISAVAVAATVVERGLTECRTVASVRLCESGSNPLDWPPLCGANFTDGSRGAVKAPVASGDRVCRYERNRPWRSRR